MNQLFLSPEHVLQGGYFHATLRKLQEQNVSIEPHNIMYPVFLIDNDDAVQPVASMPNVSRYGINQLIPVLGDLVDKGLKSILVFGVIGNIPKDASGSNADSAENPVVRGLPKLRTAFPQLLIACDVCLCPYTSHGHCGLLTPNGAIDHAASARRIAEVALAYAKAGAHVVAPSDMMDNRIKAIKEVLISCKLQNQVSVLSYSCKFASCMYGPFRDTMKSSPMEGDRKCYQLPPGSAGLAARAATYKLLARKAKAKLRMHQASLRRTGGGPPPKEKLTDVEMKLLSVEGISTVVGLPGTIETARDVAEGADFLMVKPGLPYLDIVRQTKDKFPNHPLFIYQVSGEYLMICRSGDKKEVETVLMETLTCMRRAGADCIITYFAPAILSIISRKKTVKY